MTNVADITVEILREIRDQVATTNAKLDQSIERADERADQTNARLDQTNARLDRLIVEVHDLRGELTDHKRETRAGFAAVNERLDGIVRIVGTHHTELEARVTKIEEHLALR